MKSRIRPRPNMQSQEKQDLSSFSREELEARIHQLAAHNRQLKNLLNKANEMKCKPHKKAKKGREFDFSKHSKRHVLLKFAYLGWDRQGFAVQEDSLNTVEAALFDALLTTKLIASRETSDYHRCGRTDKGVSAFAQVISITVRSRLPSQRNAGGEGSERGTEDFDKELNYTQTLNRVLPPDIRVLAWCPVEEGISARFDCIARTYKYFFPLGNLNLEAMNEAAQYLMGENDYRNLCKMDIGNGVVHFKRKILNVTIGEMILGESPPSNAPKETSSDGKCNAATPPRSWESGYRMCVATIEGVAFLWHQIRAIMTVLLLVGEEKEKPDIVRTLLDVEAVKRKPQFGFAHEVGLNLYDTQYENVSWRYDEENTVMVISQLQSIWAENAIKSSMLLHMLSDLASDLARHSKGRAAPSHQVGLCLQDPRTKVYKPLLERPTCESLEERVKHFVKRRRLDPVVLEQVQKEELRKEEEDSSS